MIGCLYTMPITKRSEDGVSTRWLAWGREATSIEAIRHVLLTYPSEPQTIAAGVAAVYRLSNKPREVLKETAFDPRMTTLAALQHVPAADLDLAELPIDVDDAAPDLLRLSLLLVGLGRAPPFMLNPSHSNEEMVRVLGRHDDVMVAQYSVWAITENPALGIRHLGVPLKNIEAQPQNVRAWMLQALGMDGAAAPGHVEIIAYGSSDPAPEARAGLAAGLKNTFFDGLEPLILNWFGSEADAETRSHLLEHMTRQAGQAVSYEDAVCALYEFEPGGSLLRRRLEAAAEGLPLYRKLKAIDHGGSADLFGGTNVTNTFNIHGNVQGGAVSIGGNATNNGSVVVEADLAQARHLLSEAERIVGGHAEEGSQKTEVLRSITEAKTDPTAEKAARALTVMKALGAAAEWGEALAPIVGLISKHFGLGG